jgi:pimeloyl-ACP methyl ester carboxylesterase
MIEIPVGEMTFRARTAGPDDGRLVILLHGFPETSASWKAQMDALAGAGYRAVAPDQRGYSPGARPEGVEHYGAGSLTADVLAIADWLGGHQFDVVGHDWGGIVAWWLGIHYPERLRSLTVASTPHPAAFADALADEGSDQRTRSGYVHVFRRRGEGEDRFLADDGAGLRRLYGSNGASPEAAADYMEVLRQPGAMTAALNWYRATSFWDGGDEGPVTVPTLYVWSDGDVALGPDAARLTANHVTGPYRFEALEGVSHWIPETASDRLNQLLLEHLGSTS